MDIATINISADWARVLTNFRAGKVDKAGLVALLRTGSPIPAEANELLAGLLEGTVAATRGNKENKVVSTVLGGLDLARFSFEVKMHMQDPSSIPDGLGKGYRNRIVALANQHGGTQTKVDEFVADLFKFVAVTSRRVRNSRTDANRLADEIARHRSKQLGRKVTREDVQREWGFSV
jgi:hypothetical protein